MYVPLTRHVQTFYAKLGWDPYPSNQITLEPTSLEASEEIEPIPGVELLQQDDIRALCDQDVISVTQSLADLPMQARNKTYAAFLPTYLQACWHFSKEDFKGTQGDKVPETKGAISPSQNVWIYWFHNTTESKLKIQRVVVLDSSNKERNIEELTSLLRQAAKEARQWGIKEVIFWNPREEVRLAAEKVAKGGGIMVKEEERMESSVPCLRWKRGRKEDVVWDCNEFYAWC
jgi:hypothetical protein